MGKRTENAGHAFRYGKAKVAEKVADAANKVADSTKVGTAMGEVADRVAMRATAASRRAREAKSDPNRK